MKTVTTRRTPRRIRPLAPRPIKRALAAGRWANSLFKLTTLAFALVVAGLVVVIIVNMAMNARLSFDKFGFDFITRSIWDPVHEEFGALPFIYGTAMSSLIALLIAVPLSVGISIFLSEHAPRRLATPIAFLVQLLAAIPSVVYGLWGIFVLAPLLRNHVYPALQKAFGSVPLFQGQINGLGLLTASIILSI